MLLVRLLCVTGALLMLVFLGQAMAVGGKPAAAMMPALFGALAMLAGCSTSRFSRAGRRWTFVALVAFAAATTLAAILAYLAKVNPAQVRFLAGSATVLALMLPWGWQVSRRYRQSLYHGYINQ